MEKCRDDDDTKGLTASGIVSLSEGHRSQRHTGAAVSFRGEMPSPFRTDRARKKDTDGTAPEPHNGPV
jgi:hypothetical protein